MLMQVMTLLGGGVLLYFGAEWLVGGASGLAHRLGLPQLLIGLTVVAYGTSAPEIVVGARASLAGASALALGNVIGSNIANVGLILGLTALVKPPRVDPSLRQRELPVLLLSTVALVAMLFDGEVSRLEGAALVVASVAYTVWMVVDARRSLRAAAEDARQMQTAADVAGAPTVRSPGRLAATAVFGLAMLVLGGNFFVDGASGMARLLGLSERLIGLTIVAVGTSLPELATSLIAAFRGASDLSVGNVVGSNIFNVLLCLGVAALLSPVQQPFHEVNVDLAVLAALTLGALVFMRGARVISRLEGAVLFVAYLMFLAGLVLR
ncbi:MAG: calcium/sodium antiporter [Archangium sp.]